MCEHLPGPRSRHSTVARLDEPRTRGTYRLPDRLVLREGRRPRRGSGPRTTRSVDEAASSADTRWSTDLFLGGGGHIRGRGVSAALMMEPSKPRRCREEAPRGRARHRACTRAMRGPLTSIARWGSRDHGGAFIFERRLCRRAQGCGYSWRSSRSGRRSCVDPVALGRSIERPSAGSPQNGPQ